MRKEWERIIPQIVENVEDIDKIKCPNCKECGIDYMYIGDSHTRIGFLQIWCNKCLKGIYVSRAVAPLRVKFVTFDTDLKDLVPKFEFIEE